MNPAWHKIGHRGTPREFPGNTLRGFKRAVELGCTMIECDVRQTADGLVVLSHDAEVVDIRDISFFISKTSSDVLHSLNLGAGEGVPTLAEVAAWAKGRCMVMTDMKCEGNGVEERVIEDMSVLDVTEKIVVGARQESRGRFRRLDLTLPLSLTLSDKDAPLVEGDRLDALLTTLDTEAVTWHHALITAERVALLHRYNKQVYVWTVDDVPTMRRMLECGVDGIISNRPDLLQTL